MELPPELAECLREARAACAGIVRGSPTQLKSANEALAALMGLEACLEFTMEQVRADAKEDAQIRVRQAESVAASRLEEESTKIMKKYREENAELSRKLSAVSQQREIGQAESAKTIRKQKDTITELTNALEQREAKYKDLWDRLENKRSDVTKLKAEISWLNRDAEKREEKLSGRLEDKRSDVADLKDEIRFLKRDAEKREEELNRCRDERDVFRGKVTGLQTVVDGLQDQVNRFLRDPAPVSQSGGYSREQLPDRHASTFDNEPDWSHEMTHQNVAVASSSEDLTSGRAFHQSKLEAVTDDRSFADSVDRRHDDRLLDSGEGSADKEPPWRSRADRAIAARGSPLKNGKDRRLCARPKTNLDICRETLLKCLKEDGGQIKTGGLQRIYQQNPGFKELIHELGGVAGMCRAISEVELDTTGNIIKLVKPFKQMNKEKHSENLSIADVKSVLLDAVNAAGGRLHGSGLAKLYSAYPGFKEIAASVGGARGLCDSGSGIKFDDKSNTFIARTKKRLAQNIQASARKRLRLN